MSEGTEDDALQSLVNASGFPLQIAIEHQVRSTYDNHGWRVRYTEHAWHNASEDQGGFIDLVLEDPFSNVLVIECKRSNGMNWVFMPPTGSMTPAVRSLAWVTRYLRSTGSFSFLGWHEVSFLPPSAEARYCVVRGQSPNDRPMLERLASGVVASTEALALEERDYRQTDFDHVQFYYSVIVTTADLHVAAFDPAQIEVTDGQIVGATFHQANYVRFRKQLSTRITPLSTADVQQGITLERRERLKEHSVMVVNAAQLIGFLRSFRLQQQSIARFAG